MIVHVVEQRSEPWHALRVGRLTGTAAADMMARIKTGEAAARRDLRLRLICERLTSVSQESGYINAEMQRGIDLEPQAIGAYEAQTGALVQPVGFCAHETLAAGCSPDGQIDGFAGLVEVKCPKSATHLGYLRSRQVPQDYLYQIVHNLWITGAQWCDFVSFDDRFPAPLQLIVIRVPRNEAEIASYEVMARDFLADVERECASVQQLAEAAA